MGDRSQVPPRIGAVATHARDAAQTVYAARLSPRQGAGRAARFAFGAGLPLALAQIALADRPARRRYLLTCAAQAAITVVIALGVVLGSERDLPLGDGSMHLHVSETKVILSSDPDPEVKVGVPAKERKGSVLAFWSSLYGALCTVEWAIIALSHEHHDAIGRNIAQLAGIPPEAPPLTPRVRLDLRWIRQRLRQKLRGLRVFLAGLPLLALLAVLPFGAALYSGASAIWGAYWFAVFVAARSALAWKEETTAPPPWFLRHAARLTGSVPGFRWWLPRMYTRLWHRFSADVFSPAASFERAPYELAGLALTRALCSMPGLYVFFRPLLPLSAAQILVLATEATDAPTGELPLPAGRGVEVAPPTRN